MYDAAFWDKLNKMEQEIALREGLKRGWFTYTELNSLISKQDVTNLINNFISFSAILAATYATGILTIAGSMFLTSKIPGTALYNYAHEAPRTDILIYESQNENNVDENLTIPESIGADEMTQYKDLHKSVTSPVTVLNTSFFLVSLLYNDSIIDSESLDVNSTWDWWNNSLMTWLNDISNFNDDEILPDKYYNNFAHDTSMDMAFVNRKLLELEDKIHKATRLRLQEQLERSWHEEWTETVYTTIGSLYEISVY